MPTESPPRLTYLAAPYKHSSTTVWVARMEAVSRVAVAFTDINHRVFRSLTYAQALLVHGFARKDDRCITTMLAGFYTVTSWWF